MERIGNIPVSDYMAVEVERLDNIDSEALVKAIEDLGYVVSIPDDLAR